MATRRRRKVRRNSAVRMDEDFIINPAKTDEITITIKGPKGVAENIASDLSMLAMQKDIPNTRGNPRKKAAKKRKRKVRMKKVFGNPVTHLPKTKARTGTHAFVGRPVHDKWYIADLYDANQKKIISHYGKGGRKEAETEAQDFLDRRAKSRGGSKSRTVKSVIFSGPYSRKPTAKTRRK